MGLGPEPSLFRSNLRIAYLAAHGLYLRAVPLRDGRRLCLGTYLERHARARPRGPALRFEERQYTYEELNAKANQVAHALSSLGASRGEVVALLMDNRPEYLFTVLGANKLGVVTALVNTHVVGDALAHALRIAKPAWVVVGDEHLASLTALGSLPVPPDRVLVWAERETNVPRAEGRDLGTLVETASTENPASTGRQVIGAPALYIYTSGTTGLPKAATMSHQRMLRSMHVFADVVARTTPSDVIYGPGLPFYHSSGMMVAFGMALVPGATLAFRRRFSASAFWHDVRRFDATVFVYIGELCRYLMHRPVDAEERGHRLRLATGAGLRADIWERFTERFAIPEVREFYGATEGNVGLINLDGVPGMLGRRLPGQAIVKTKPGTAEPERDAGGRLVPAKVGDDGILLGPINFLNAFDGYVDRSKNASKILVDPFGDGTSYFNTGDLVKLHPRGYVSFSDRLGDTFRWKGENVSTTEVENIVSSAPGVLEANVYGVEVPGHDGRAGMAALVVEPGFDLEDFAGHVLRTLPKYARPLFVRIGSEMATTASLKYVKTHLREDGFDPSKVRDPLYCFEAERYVPLDAERFDRLVRGEVRL